MQAQHVQPRAFKPDPLPPAALQALRSVVPYLQGRALHAVLFVERLDEYRVDSVDHQVGLKTDWGGGVQGTDVCGNHAGRAFGCQCCVFRASPAAS